MDKHRIRNVLPPLYAILILLGFLIGSSVGLIVLIVGGVLFSLAWTTLSRGGPGAGAGRDRGRDRSARAERRNGRR